jgi:hypothetical protein
LEKRVSRYEKLEEVENDVYDNVPRHETSSSSTKNILGAQTYVRRARIIG